MSRVTRVLSEKDRQPDAWITVGCSEIIQIPARYGNHFRVYLNQNATLEPPIEGHPGQVVALRIENAGSYTLTANVNLVFRNGETTLPLVSSGVTLIFLRYDDDGKAWEVFTPLSRARAAALYAPVSVVGTVTSVNVSLTFAASAGDVTTAGTVALTWNTVVANRVFAGPTTGGDAVPTFRALVAADIPAIVPAWTYVATAISYVAVIGELVNVNATGGARIVTLPTAVGVTGKAIAVRKSDSSGNAVTVDTTGGQTINGAATDTIAAQYETYTYVSDGANWMVT